MRADLRPYSRMRNSGVKWLGEVPEHWEVRRVATVAELRVSNVDKHVREGEFNVRLCNYLDVYHNERITANIPFMAGTATGREMRRFRLSVGDVLVTKDSEDWFDIGVPALIEYAARDLVCGYHLAMLRPNGKFLDGGYLFQALTDCRVAWQWQVAATGVTRYGLSSNAIKSMRIPLPPLREQRAIARFLDHADRRIRRYIRAKERLIDLLGEQERTAIHQAITGRIDVCTGRPYPAYQDTGVEWLGEVPEHWEVAALRYRYDQCLGKMLDAKRISGAHLIPYLRNADVQWDHINVAGLPRMDIHPRELERYSVRPGDLLVCEGGEVGRCAIWEGEIRQCGYQKALHRLRPWDDDRDMPRFLCYVLRVATGAGAFTDGHESTIAHLTGEKLRGHRFAFPPPAEQRSIVAALNRSRERHEALVSAQNQAVALLREYRTRLVADVVTGKLDVRDAAANFPVSDSLTDRNRDSRIDTENTRTRIT